MVCFVPIPEVIMSVRLQPLVEQQNRAVEDFHAIGTVIPLSVFLRWGGGVGEGGWGRGLVRG